MASIKVTSCANIALNKYWGKRDEILFLPTKNSLSVGIDSLKTTTVVGLNSKDVVRLDGQLLDEQASRSIINFLNRLRVIYGINYYFSIESTNHFPTAAGLASSASGYAALALGLNALCKLNLSLKECSILARQGSGSASRSIFGGFVQWHKGEKADGSDSYAEQLFDAGHWPELRVIIVVVNKHKKKISSRSGMQLTVATSSSYHDWLRSSDHYLEEIIIGLKDRALERVGKATESDWHGMYKAMLDTRPCLDYLTPPSHEIINCVKTFREKAVECYFTTDAGPNVKILCLQNDVSKITSVLQQNTSIENIIVSRVSSNPIIEVCCV